MKAFLNLPKINLMRFLSSPWNLMMITHIHWRIIITTSLSHSTMKKGSEKSKLILQEAGKKATFSHHNPEHQQQKKHFTNFHFHFRGHWKQTAEKQGLIFYKFIKKICHVFGEAPKGGRERKRKGKTCRSRKETKKCN